MILDDEADKMLRQWAIWSVTNTGVRTKYPSIEPFTKMVTMAPMGAQITDEEAMRVDAAVLTLLKINDLAGRLLINYYRLSCNMPDAMRATKIQSYRKSEDLMTFAVSCVATQLYKNAA